MARRLGALAANAGSVFQTAAHLVESVERQAREGGRGEGRKGEGVPLQVVIAAHVVRCMLEGEDDLEEEGRRIASEWGQWGCTSRMKERNIIVSSARASNRWNESETTFPTACMKRRKIR